MPTETTHRCDVCGVAVNDAELESDTTLALRRIIVAGGSTARGVAPAGETPATVEQRQYPQLVFCGYAHAGEWLAAQSF